MRWKNYGYILILSFAWIGASCTSQTVRPGILESTQTPASDPGPTLASISTNASGPSDNPVDSSIQTPEITTPKVVLQEVQVMPEGGYAFQEPRLYQVMVKGSQALITNEDESILMSMVSSSPSELASVTQMLASFLGRMSDDIEAFKSSQPYPVTVGGEAGLASDVTGTMFGSQITGRAVVSGQGNSRVFFAFGFGKQGQTGDAWEAEGQELFETVLHSVVFLEAGRTACEVSADETYGYSAENPIQIGGGAFNGPGRENAYFQTLRGPNGETFAFERQGAIQPGETVIDHFEITFDSDSPPVTLFLDEYHYSAPKAPTGFTCIGPFPIGEP